MHGGGFGGTFNGGAIHDEFFMQAHSANYTIEGGGGSDEMTLADGEETLLYDGPATDSSGVTHDHVFNFDADEDQFDTSITVTSVSTDSGNVSSATFDSDLASQANDWVGAKVFSATGGDLIGNVYLLIDINASVSYEVGVDLVINITGFTGTIDTTDFI
jgi:hypothetical protein